ncbi:MAG TPA: UDP-N-acetylmuramate dehydrogenase [bacterium]|nr:UDP-N-acetylmuramate dehydrogenase [bacterium]
MLDWRRNLGEALAGCAAELKFAEPLAQHTSFRIGGLADAWVRVDDRQALARVVQVCRDTGVRMWLLGRGSNVLVSDQGLRGVVITLGGELAKMKGPGARGEGLGSEPQSPDPNPQPLSLVCGAGANLDEVATIAEREGLVGAEFLAGIPGTVGGGLRTNAGALGRSLGDVLSSVTAIDLDGNEQTLTGAQLRREYRRPIIDRGLVAVEVTMALAGGGGRGARGESAQEIRKQRWEKHPKEPSAGSFFRNPETGDGGRVPAGKLIEECGLKGKTVGGAKVSEKHANFLVNTGKARFADVYELAQIVKATVEERTGILLEEEVQYLPGPGETRIQNSELRMQNSQNKTGVANGR